MNEPYVKEYNELGVLQNPIKHSYVSAFPNRKKRREKPTRFMGNTKGIKLTVSPLGKFRRHLQIIEVRDKNGAITGTKKIEHYLQS